MLLNMLYPALRSPLFVGPESYLFLRFFLNCYFEELDDILSLPAVRAVT